MQQTSTATTRLERAVRRTSIRGRDAVTGPSPIEPVTFRARADQDDPWAEAERAFDRRHARSTVTFYARRSF